MSNYENKEDEVIVGFGAGLVPTYGNYVGPGHGDEKGEVEPVDQFDGVAALHDACYQAGMDKSRCDGAMANDLRHVDEPDTLYGALYMRAADMWMDAVGTNTKESLLEVLKEAQTQKVPQAFLRRELRRTGMPGIEARKLLPELTALVNERERRKEHPLQDIEEVPSQLITHPRYKHIFTENKGGKKQGRRNRNRKAARRNRSGGGLVAKVRQLERANRRKGPRRIKNRLNQVKGLRGKRNMMMGIAQFEKSNMRKWSVREISGRNSQGVVLVGSDLIDGITTGAIAPVTGTEIFTQPASPMDASWSFTRLQQFAPLFQKFKFRKLIYRYEPVTNVTRDGGFAGYVDTDTSSTYESIDNTLSALQIATARQNAREFEVWKKQSFSLPQLEDPHQVFWMQQAPDSTEPRLFSQGRVHLLAQSNLLANQAYGLLYVDYEVELWEQSLANDLTSDIVGHNLDWVHLSQETGAGVSAASLKFGDSWAGNTFGSTNVVVQTGGDTTAAAVQISMGPTTCKIENWPSKHIRLLMGSVDQALSGFTGALTNNPAFGFMTFAVPSNITNVTMNCMTASIAVAVGACASYLFLECDVVDVTIPTTIQFPNNIYTGVTITPGNITRFVYLTNSQISPHITSLSPSPFVPKPCLHEKIAKNLRGNMVSLKGWSPKRHCMSQGRACGWCNKRLREHIEREEAKEKEEAGGEFDSFTKTFMKMMGSRKRKAIRVCEESSSEEEDSTSSSSDEESEDEQTPLSLKDTRGKAKRKREKHSPKVKRKAKKQVNLKQDEEGPPEAMLEFMRWRDARALELQQRAAIEELDVIKGKEFAGEEADEQTIDRAIEAVEREQAHRGEDHDKLEREWRNCCEAVVRMEEQGGLQAYAKILDLKYLLKVLRGEHHVKCSVCDVYENRIPVLEKRVEKLATTEKSTASAV